MGEKGSKEEEQQQKQQPQPVREALLFGQSWEEESVYTRRINGTIIDAICQKVIETGSPL